MYTRLGIEKRGFKFFERLKMHTKAENLYFGFVFTKNPNFFQALAKYGLAKHFEKKFENFDFGLHDHVFKEITEQIYLLNQVFVIFPPHF